VAKVFADGGGCAGRRLCRRAHGATRGSGVHSSRHRRNWVCDYDRNALANEISTEPFAVENGWFESINCEMEILYPESGFPDAELGEATFEEFKNTNDQARAADQAIERAKKDN
jgi:hypothetical protein